jgi:putative ABC transport system substrate-binding protein
VEVTQQGIRRREDIASAFDAIKGHASAVNVVENALTAANADDIAALALKALLPTTFTTAASARAGALMSYGANVPALFRHAADYVDKILHGTKPAYLTFGVVKDSGRARPGCGPIGEPAGLA